MLKQSVRRDESEKKSYEDRNAGWSLVSARLRKDRICSLRRQILNLMLLRGAAATWL